MLLNSPFSPAPIPGLFKNRLDSDAERDISEEESGQHASRQYMSKMNSKFRPEDHDFPPHLSSFHMASEHSHKRRREDQDTHFIEGMLSEGSSDEQASRVESRVRKMSKKSSKHLSEFPNDTYEDAYGSPKQSFHDAFAPNSSMPKVHDQGFTGLENHAYSTLERQDRRPVDSHKPLPFQYPPTQQFHPHRQQQQQIHHQPQHQHQHQSFPPAPGLQFPFFINAPGSTVNGMDMTQLAVHQAAIVLASYYRIDPMQLHSLALFQSHIQSGNGNPFTQQPFFQSNLAQNPPFHAQQHTAGVSRKPSNTTPSTVPASVPCGLGAVNNTTPARPCASNHAPSRSPSPPNKVDSPEQKDGDIHDSASDARGTPDEGCQSPLHPDMDSLSVGGEMGHDRHHCDTADHTAQWVSGQPNANMVSNLGRRFKCEECGKQYKQKSHLMVHRRTHEGVRPFPCTFEDCPKSFVTNSALRAHMRVHSGERPYSCGYPACNRIFSTNSNLRRHERTHAHLNPNIATFLQSHAMMTHNPGQVMGFQGDGRGDAHIDFAYVHS